MISPTAILIAATLAFLGVLGVFGLGIYFGFRFLTTVAILKAAPDAKSAAAMMRATGTQTKTQDPEKVPMEMPATGIEGLADSPDAMARLRKKQDPSPDPY